MKTQKTIINFNRIPKTLALSIASSLMLVGCSFNVSTAKLENIKTCSEIVNDKECASDLTKFAQNTPQLFVTADLKYAPEGTNVKIDWKYLGGEAGNAAPIDTVNLKTESNTSVITSTLTASNKGWPTGDYEVVLSLDTDNSKPIHKKFSVVNSQ